MNHILKPERAILVHGVQSRALSVIADDKTGRILNQSILSTREYTERGAKYRITGRLRFDDECHNGHESFSITADIHEWRNGAWREYTGGCCHDEIARRFPEWAHLIPWHLTSTDGPMHYEANTVYLAGNRDCHGLLAGEFRQHTSRGPHQADGVPGVPHWELDRPDMRDVYATEKPAPVVLEWKPSGRTGEGKARELEAARRAAVWPDATDAELMQEPDALRAALAARLPALLARFKADMLACGFVWPAVAQ